MDDVDYKRSGWPNMLNDALLMTVNDIVLVPRMSSNVINRQHLINIGNGVISANNTEMLKGFVGVIGLTEGWAKSVLKSLNWSKRRATTSKVRLFTQLLAKEKFTFQKAITKAIQGNDIPPDLVINLDHTPSCYVSPGKYSFHFKGSKHVPVKGVDDKRHIAVTFGVSAVGDFLPTQVIYVGKRNAFCRNSTSQNDFQCRSWKITGPVPQNPWSFS